MSSLYDRASETNLRIRQLNESLKLWLASHPDAKIVRMRHVQESLLQYFESKKETPPYWIFNSNLVGQLLKASGYEKRRKPEFTTYILDPSHADKILGELHEIAEEIAKTRINLAEYLPILHEFCQKCANDLHLDLFKPLTFIEQKALCRRELVCLELLPSQVANFLRPLLETNLKILEENIKAMP